MALANRALGGAGTLGGPAYVSCALSLDFVVEK